MLRWAFATFERPVPLSLPVGFYYPGAVAAPIIGLVMMRQVTQRIDRLEVPDEVMGKTRNGCSCAVCLACGCWP